MLLKFLNKEATIFHKNSAIALKKFAKVNYDLGKLQ